MQTFFNRIIDKFIANSLENKYCPSRPYVPNRVLSVIWQHILAEVSNRLPNKIRAPKRCESPRRVLNLFAQKHNKTVQRQYQKKIKDKR